MEPGNHPNKPEEGWIQVTRKGKETSMTEPAVEKTVKPTTSETTTETTTAVPTPKPIEPARSAPPTPSPAKKFKRKIKKKKADGEQPEEMKISTNQKRLEMVGNQSQKSLYTNSTPP